MRNELPSIEEKQYFEAEEVEVLRNFVTVLCNRGVQSSLRFLARAEYQANAIADAAVSVLSMCDTDVNDICIDVTHIYQEAAAIRIVCRHIDEHAPTVAWLNAIFPRSFRPNPALQDKLDRLFADYVASAVANGGFGDDVAGFDEEDLNTMTAAELGE